MNIKHWTTFYESYAPPVR